jgi:hypothetical protein
VRFRTVQLRWDSRLCRETGGAGRERDVDAPAKIVWNERIVFVHTGDDIHHPFAFEQAAPPLAGTSRSPAFRRRPCDVEIGQDGEVHASHQVELRGDHRAKLADADQRDPDGATRLFAGEELWCAVHAIASSFANFL